jgi:hypothetical protein
MLSADRQKNKYKNNVTSKLLNGYLMNAEVSLVNKK